MEHLVNVRKHNSQTNNLSAKSAGTAYILIKPLPMRQHCVSSVRMVDTLPKKKKMRKITMLSMTVSHVLLVGFTKMLQKLATCAQLEDTATMKQK